jgi:predicted nucleic acid-binding protein
VLLDTNVFVDFLRAELHSDWVFGGATRLIRFIPAVALMELYLGANTPAREKAVGRLEAAFKKRVIAPSPPLYAKAGRLFRVVYGDRSAGTDRLGAMNDVLIALTACEIGATVVTSNVAEFARVAEELSGLRILAPSAGM